MKSNEIVCLDSAWWTHLFSPMKSQFWFSGWISKTVGEFIMKNHMFCSFAITLCRGHHLVSYLPWAWVNSWSPFTIHWSFLLFTIYSDYAHTNTATVIDHSNYSMDLPYSMIFWFSQTPMRLWASLSHRELICSLDHSNDTIPFCFIVNMISNDSIFKIIWKCVYIYI